tara:strand:- start:425 stop:952 length:528 start_codon:yes stop_codon:yes gene_type:complete
MMASEPLWELRHRSDPECRGIADRHYNRQKIGAIGFVPPGRCVVLLANNGHGKALWVTSWPFAEYVKHEWGGAWICSCFRNEGAGLSSDLIREAVAVTRWVWPDVPEQGIITFVDRKKTIPKKDPGYCYQMAGWSICGKTKVHGLTALSMQRIDMPEPIPPLNGQFSMWSGLDTE